ncbi:MAG TPA: heme o synthase [Kineosporiaceae bacterium]|nr:heme o synthase [Kineosporiaceae bacterium]
MTTLDRRPSAALRPPVIGFADRRRLVMSYIALTKPRIIELLLVTTVPTMILAQRGLPSLWLVAATLVGGSLAAGSANTLNCYLDRDIDEVMHRTERRPLVTGEIPPLRAMAFGIVLGVIAVGLLAATVNVLSAVLALAAILFYVFIYTLMLKRRTPQNIVWGGAAGCMPVLIGWAAVTDSLSWAPVVLFMIIFLWTPPHYWPLSLRYKDDYAAAGVPMLPVVASPAVVAQRVVTYTWAMVLCSVTLVPVAHTGPVYAVVAVGLGAVFLKAAYGLRSRARAEAEDLAPMRVFHLSISYLTLLFVAIALDPFITVPFPHL